MSNGSSRPDRRQDRRQDQRQDRRQDQRTERDPKRAQIRLSDRSHERRNDALALLPIAGAVLMMPGFVHWAALGGGSAGTFYFIFALWALLILASVLLIRRFDQRPRSPLDTPQGQSHPQDQAREAQSAASNPGQAAQAPHPASAQTGRDRS
ncbi:MAG: hypothetical protein MRY63_03990 [Neomegalonema sp.]|nr:hypothetical protein [Neomegalonema sp.]